MEKPTVTGVQHVGIGVRDIEASRAFYRDVLQCTQRMADFGLTHNAMPDFFRASAHVFNAWMYGQEKDAIVIECVQRFEPSPRSIRRQNLYGDIGVNKITVEVSDAAAFRKAYGDRIRFLCEPKTARIPGWGDYSFVYGTDPDGNLIEFASCPQWEVLENPGRIRSLGIGVTDLDRSMEFYTRHLGFDQVVIAPHESFSGLVGEVSGSSSTQVRSCLLGSSNGFHLLELLEVSKPRGRSIPFNALWGDYGFLEGCCLCLDVLGMARYLMKEGVDLLSHPTAVDVHEAGLEGTGWFLYAKDPDGIPVELLELPG